MADGWLLWYPTHRTRTKTSDGWGTPGFGDGQGFKSLGCATRLHIVRVTNALLRGMGEGIGKE
jgi:hypothetical protein